MSSLIVAEISKVDKRQSGHSNRRGYPNPRGRKLVEITSQTRFDADHNHERTSFARVCFSPVAPPPISSAALINEEMFGNRAPFFLHPLLHRHMLKPHAGFIDFSKAATSSSPYLGRNGAPDKQSQIACGEINLSPLVKAVLSSAQMSVALLLS